MSGLLRRLRPSSDATPRADAAPAAAPQEPASDGPTDPAAPEAPAVDGGEGTPEPDATAAAAAPAEPETALPTAELPPQHPPAEGVTEVMPAAAPVMTSGDLPGEPGREVATTAAVPATLPGEADDIVEERPLPAGVAPEDLIGERPNTRRRGRLRRRARHLRHVRELMLRDIGGLVNEIHRAGGAGEHGTELVRGKLDRLALLDAERGELEEALGLVRAETVLREPGVGGTCPTCAEYFASDAHFCFRCGTRVDGRPEPHASAAPAAEAPAGLWAGDRTPAAIGPAPVAEPAAAEPATEPLAESQPDAAESEPVTASDPEPQPAVAEPVAAEPEPEPATADEPAAVQHDPDAPADPARTEASS